MTTFETVSKPTSNDVREERPQERQPARRHAVCSESITDEEIANYKKIIIEKTPEQMRALNEAFSKNILFKDMEDKVVNDIVDVVELKQYEDGDLIIKQGERGDYFYIIHEGKVDVIISGVTVGSITSGGSFGELALIYGSPRAATIKAIGPVSTFRLNRSSYRILIMMNHVDKYEKYEAFLKRVPILSSLNSKETLMLADALLPVTYQKDEVVVKQGEEGHEFFIIMEGKAQVLQRKDETSDEVVVNTLTESNYFGELALLFNQPRAATVKAVGDQLKCVKVDRERFERILGPCQEILKRNMENYNSIVKLVK